MSSAGVVMEDISDFLSMFLGEPEPEPEPEPLTRVWAPSLIPSTSLEDSLQALKGVLLDLPRRSQGFLVEPDLSQVALAIQDLLEASGANREALVAGQWAWYESQGRRTSKQEEARVRAEAIYRSELELLKEGFNPLQTSTRSALLWRQPEQEDLPIPPPPKAE